MFCNFVNLIVLLLFSLVIFFLFLYLWRFRNIVCIISLPKNILLFLFCILERRFTNRLLRLSLPHDYKIYCKSTEQEYSEYLFLAWAGLFKAQEKYSCLECYDVCKIRKKYFLFFCEQCYQVNLHIVHGCPFRRYCKYVSHEDVLCVYMAMTVKWLIVWIYWLLWSFVCL